MELLSYTRGQRWRSYFTGARRRAALWALLTLAPLLVIWWWAVDMHRTRLMAEQRARASYQLSLHGNGLTTAIKRRFALLRGLHAFVSTKLDRPEGDLDAEFETFAAGLRAGFNGIQAVQIVREGVIRYNYPELGNERATGYDLLADPRPFIGRDIERAIESRDITVTGPVELVQGGQSLVVRLAVFDRRESPWGLVALVLSLPPIFDEAGLSFESDGPLSMALRDRSGQMFYGSKAVFESDPVTHSIDLPDGSWEMSAIPAVGWDASIRALLFPFQWAGLAIVGLLCALVYAVAYRQERLSVAVRQRTEELSLSNEALQADIAERKRIEEALRESEELYRTLARNFPNGAVVLFDSDLRFLIAEGMGLADVGLSSERMEGHTIWDVFPKEVWEAIESDYRAALAGEATLNELTYKRNTYFTYTLPVKNERGEIIAGMVMTQNITERKQAEKALRESETRLAEAQRIAHIGSWDSSLGAGEDIWSDESYRLLGFEPGAISACLDTLLGCIHPDDKQLMRDIMVKAIKEGQGFEAQARIILPDGRIRYLQTAGEVVRGEDGRTKRMFGTALDVTERKQAEDALTRAAERLAALNRLGRVISSSLDIRKVYDAFAEELSRLIAFDRTAIAILNEAKTEWEHVAFWTRYEPLVRRNQRNPVSGSVIESIINDHQPVIERELGETGEWAENEWLRREGIRSRILMPLIIEEQVVGILALASRQPGLYTEEDIETLRPLTDQLGIALHNSQLYERVQRHAEELEQGVAERTLELKERLVQVERLNYAMTNLLEDLQSAHHHLEATARRLQESRDEMESFAYSVSHDLRAPLRAMQGLAIALLEDYADSLDETGQDFARRIADASQQMDALIQDLLAYSRIVRTELHLQPVSLDRVIQEALSQAKAEIDGGHIVVENHLPDVLGHPIILVQVVSNLVYNAVKFVEPGVQPRVRMRAEDRGAHVRLWVEDNGIGILPEHQERIFRVFERLHGIETYHGTGIGLAIVKKGVERMGGRVGVESAPGEGSRFWVELPKAKDHV